MNRKTNFVVPQTDKAFNYIKKQLNCKSSAAF